VSELEEISESLIEGNEGKTQALAQSALDKGISAFEILNKGLLAGMNVIGKRFKQADIFIPEVLLAARAMNAGVLVLKPLLLGQDFHDFGCIVLGTVKGDIHEIGKNLVGVMLNGAGFNVIDLGTGVPPEKFLEAAVEKKANLIAMSALLTTTMPFIKDTVEALRESGMGSQIKTMIGGAVITQEYADEIGADGYAADAVSAVAKAKELLNIS